MIIIIKIMNQNKPAQTCGKCGVVYYLKRPGICTPCLKAPDLRNCGVCQQQFDLKKQHYTPKPGSYYSYLSSGGKNRLKTYLETGKCGSCHNNNARVDNCYNCQNQGLIYHGKAYCVTCEPLFQAYWFPGEVPMGVGMSPDFVAKLTYTITNGSTNPYDGEYYETEYDEVYHRALPLAEFPNPILGSECHHLFEEGPDSEKASSYENTYRLIASEIIARH